MCFRALPDTAADRSAGSSLQGPRRIARRWPAKARLGYLVLGAPLFWACASVTPIGTVATPGTFILRGVEVSAQAGDCSVRLTVRNASGSRLRVSAFALPVTVGSRTTVEERITGYRDEVVCDGEVCRLVQVPVIARSERIQPIPAELLTTPARALVEPGAEAAMAVSLLNPQDADTEFSLDVLLLVRGEQAPFRIRVLSSSEELMRTN